MPLTQGFLANFLLYAILLVFSKFLWNYVRSPLKSFPGPPSASFTNIWRFQDVFRGRCDITHLNLHRKFGPAVRMGPNVLSLSDPTMIKVVYTARNPWLKSNMYNVNDVSVSGDRHKNLFSHQDEDWHSKFIRPIKGLYSMTKVRDFEPGIDKIIGIFMEKIQEGFITSGKLCEMSEYISYCAWDMMSQVTFSKSLGLLQTGYDSQRMLDTSSKSLDYFASVGYLAVTSQYSSR